MKGKIDLQQGRIQGEASGTVPPPRTQRYHTFQILNWWVKNIIKISLLFWIGGLKGAPPPHLHKKYILFQSCNLYFPFKFTEYT